MTGLTSLLVDGLRAGRIELLGDGILVVAEHEDDLPRLAGGQVELHLMRADGRPAVGDGVGELAGFHGGGLVPAAIAAQEGLALRVEAGAGLRAGEVGKVVAALAVLGLVIDDAVFDLHLPMLKLRWKLVASSWASHRQNSMLAKAEMAPLSRAGWSP
jgi:hypothetical protein